MLFQGGEEEEEEEEEDDGNEGREKIKGKRNEEEWQARLLSDLLIRHHQDASIASLTA